MKKQNVKSIVDYTLLVIAFVSILILGIIEGQDAIKMIPALFGLFVFILSSKAFRVAYLLGSINSAIYSIGYFMSGLYGNAFANLILYVPLQLFTFLRWSKQKYKHTTIFKRMPVKYEIALFIGVIIAWFGCGLILANIPGSSSVPFLDAVSTVLGPIAATMSIFALIETIGYELILTGTNVVMWVVLLISNPADITYLITTCFTMYCMISKAMTWIKLYKEQQAEKNSEENSEQNTAN